MRRTLPSAIPSRALAIGLVLMAHVLLFLLLLFGIRSPPRLEAELIQFVSLWPDLEPATPEPETAAALPTEASPRAVLTPRVPDVVPPAEPRPDTEVSTAITSPPIDWLREGAAAAKRQSERAPERETFSAPPGAARKPCEPPESSFVWNPETPRAGFTTAVIPMIPLPFVQLGKRCVVGLGFFGCNLGELPKANRHLFDDVKEGKTMESSVPDPNICD